jgi:hypothetical protein
VHPRHAFEVSAARRVELVVLYHRHPLCTTTATATAAVATGGWAGFVVSISGIPIAPVWFPLVIAATTATNVFVKVNGTPLLDAIVYVIRVLQRLATFPSVSISDIIIVVIARGEVVVPARRTVVIAGVAAAAAAAAAFTRSSASSGFERHRVRQLPATPPYLPKSVRCHERAVTSPPWHHHRDITTANECRIITVV